MKTIVKKIMDKENFRIKNCPMYKKYSGISIVKMYDNVVYYDIIYSYNNNEQETKRRKLEF